MEDHIRNAEYVWGEDQQTWRQQCDIVNSVQQYFHTLTPLPQNYINSNIDEAHKIILLLTFGWHIENDSIAKLDMIKKP